MTHEPGAALALPGALRSARGILGGACLVGSLGSGFGEDGGFLWD